MSELFFFFFNDTATTDIYTLSLHDALPIYFGSCDLVGLGAEMQVRIRKGAPSLTGPLAAQRLGAPLRSEEHTSELQSRPHLVCRLLLEKKKKKKETTTQHHQ